MYPYRVTTTHCDTAAQMTCQTSIWRQTTDNSFEYVERMCNKTLAARNSINPEIISTYNKHSKANDTIEDDETNTLHRLLNLFNVKTDSNKAHLCDQTQLSDIEAPSCLWENTMSADMTLAQHSPVKMVGLMRPSTILEESAKSLSSSNSFKSALKYDETLSSDQYETANDSARTDMVSGIQSNNNKQKKSFDDRSKTTESIYGYRNNDTSDYESDNELNHQNQFVKTENDTSNAQKLEEQIHSPIITERSNFIYNYSNDARMIANRP